MRRRRAAIFCLGPVAALWRVWLFFTAVTSLASSVVEATQYELTVTSAESLRHAFVNHNVSTIYLGQDIALSRSHWTGGFASGAHTAIVLERNLSLTSHPSLREPAVLFLDYMEHCVVAGTGVEIKINGVVMTGVSRDALKYFFIPFFQFHDGGTLYIQNSQYQMAIDPMTLWSLDAYPSRMNATARPAGFENWPVEAFVVTPEDCAAHSLREQPCQDGAVLVGSLSARLTVFDEATRPIGKATFLAQNVLIIAETIKEPQPVEFRTVNITTGLEFKKALQNPAVAEIHVLNDIRLTKELFSPSIRTPITRNLTITSASQLNRSAVINFSYLESAVVAGAEVEIRLVHLNFTQVSKKSKNFELVPFFSLQPGATYLYRDIVSEMALSSGALYPLKELPYVFYGGDVPENFGNITNEVEAVGPAWCAHDGRISCPQGALYITRGIRGLEVLDVYTQEVLGKGFVDLQDTLIRVIDFSKNDLNTLTRPVPLVDVQDQTEPESELQETEETEDAKSFGFVGGFDPWILIYALIAAATILGTCLFIIIVRRSRERRLYKDNPSLKRDDSFIPIAAVGGEDERISAHQQVARQLLGDVKLGTLLGCGSFGRVYKAMWTGAQVAVKVILHQEDEAEVEQEAQFSISLRHPNVVQTFHYAVRTVDTADPTPKKEDKETTVVDINCETLSSPIALDKGMNLPSSWMKTTNGGEMFDKSCPTASAQSSAIRTENQSHGYSEERWLEMWLIQEYCNLGSLGKQNHLRINDQHSAWGSKNPSMVTVVDTCKDIARGMKYLHDNGIVHGDLKCDNVLLQSSHVQEKGFSAKVADFGLSRKLGHSTHLSTKSFGTITHMPPELLLEGHLSSKVDVYSFGVIMWELVTGLQPFRELRYAEVMRAIVVDDRRPVFAPETQADYVALAKRCWDRDPTKRPLFGVVLTELDKISSNVSEGSLFDSSSGSWNSESDDEIGSANKGCSA